MALQPSDVKENALHSLVSPSSKSCKRKKTAATSSLPKGPVSLNPAKSRSSPVNPKKRKVTRDKENGENDERSESKELTASVQLLLSLVSSRPENQAAYGPFAESNSNDSVASSCGSDHSNASSPQVAVSCENSPFPSPSLPLSASSFPFDSRLHGYHSNFAVVSDDSSASLPPLEQTSEGLSQLIPSQEEKKLLLVNRWLFEYEACVTELEAGYAPRVLVKLPLLMDILRSLVPSSPGPQVPYWWCFVSAMHFLGFLWSCLL
jgi:hypothetical protein